MVQDSPALVEPEPPFVEPEPLLGEPEPEALEPEPWLGEPEPDDVDPEPWLGEPDPAIVEPELQDETVDATQADPPPAPFTVELVDDFGSTDGFVPLYQPTRAYRMSRLVRTLRGKRSQHHLV